MPSSFIQENRIIKLTTPLGPDALVVTSLQGREGISQLFHFELGVVWQDPGTLDFTDILGKTVTIEINDEDPPRYINGIVYAVEQGARDRSKDMTHYTLQVVPNTWILTRNIQSRIFQKKSVPDIVQQVLADMGLSATLKNSLMGSYKPRDYCVQYRESDFAFISRLMESEGIYYFFQHDDSQHTLVMADNATSFQDVPAGAEIEFEEMVGGVREKSRIYEWARAQEIRSGKYVQGDWNFETPSNNLRTNETFTQKVANNQRLEIYEHPGGYMKPGDGEPLTKARLQEENTPGQVARGSSWHCNLCPGYKFSLKNHFSDDGKYILTSVDHSAHQPLDADDVQNPFGYQNRFTAIPSDTVYRPPRVTPQPRIQGVQTAIVVGPGGEEIYTDKYGRVKVQFHWDREGKKDENSSCWTRVATFWAGKNWGAIHIPRIGQEVIVDFEDGDVDRPLIVGSVYNAMQMPPYALPGEKTKSTVQSRSSKGGGPSNFNEIRFEDKMGSEEIYVHAEKDRNMVVENNETLKIGSPKAPDGSLTTEIYKDETRTIKTGNQALTIEQGNQDTQLKMGNQSTKLDMGNQSTKLSMGNQDTKLDLGAATTEAMQSITLKVGQSSITIDQMGVTIKGMMISVQAQVQAEVKAVMTAVSGDAMTTVKGAIVMIN